MNTLAKRNDSEVMEGSWMVMREQASMLTKTGFLPEAIKTPEQAVAIMLKGRELGVPVMYSLSNISIIKGKPAAGAELLLAVVYRDHGDNAIRVTRTDADVCTVAYKRRGWSSASEYSFTLQDAKQAGLMNNPMWLKYPAAMLRARCISAVARLAFADSIGGMYTPEELGAAVTVDDETGEVVTVTPVANVPKVSQKEDVSALQDEYENLRIAAAARGIQNAKGESFIEAAASWKASHYEKGIDLIQSRIDAANKAALSNKPVGNPNALQEKVAEVRVAATQQTPEQIAETAEIFGDDEVVEAEVVEAETVETITEAQRGAILALSSQVFGRETKEKVAAMCEERGIASVADLSKAQAHQFIANLRSMLPELPEKAVA